MQSLNRSHYCGSLRESHVGEKVQLKGWVQRRRDLGGLIFLDLRDRTGIVQVVVNPETSKDAWEQADKARNEFVLDIQGEVVAREASTYNDKIATGKIEVQASSVTIINASKPSPFVIENDTDASEETRLKYRYLDLRRQEMQETLKLRSKVTKYIRNFLDDNDFLDIETPILTKSTPEGARDYLVPSRVHEGQFYALPQSPQLFKQLLMVSGFDRYYQIARCFRDEDLRADRQPEFTQVDIETSFLETDDLLAMMEEMMTMVLKEVKGVDIPKPFPRMSYQEAMDRFGSDKPDTRFGMEIVNVSEIVKDSSFKVFANTVNSGGRVSAINVKGAADKYSRKDIDKLMEFVANYGAKGLAWVKLEEDSYTGPIAKFFEGEIQSALNKAMEAEAGDLLLFVADSYQVAADSLGALRLKLAKELDLIDQSKFNFLWITDWPLLEFDPEAGRYFAAHHPFTMPVREDLPMLDENPEKVRANAYDLVLNGYELGGGSQRIYERNVQEKMLKALGFSEEEAREQFGFLLDAFEYGTPPHGGIAFGLDRFVMILAGRTNLRDTIAFPKTASAGDLLTNAPSNVDTDQLLDLHLSIRL